MNSNFFTTLVCLDSNVDNYQDLVQDLTSSIKIIIFDETQDGITQITEALRTYPSILTVHIIAHGSPGCLYLGNNSLSLETLGRYSSALQSWFSQAAKSAIAHPQILLYGCNVAAGDAGAEFLSKLHELTQASIAASTTLVGHTALGSNWQLDYQLGQTDAKNPIALDVLQAYQGVLVAPTITDTLTLTRSTSEETTLTISGLSIADSDTPTQSVTLAVTNGKVLLASTTGLTVTGNNSSSITLSGAIANVNAALNGMTYTPNLDYANSETLVLTTNDGTTTVSKNVAIAVTPVNDVPIMVPTAASMAEGGTGSFAAVNFGLSDVDNVAAQIIIKIAALPSKGFLTFNGSRLVVGSTFSSDQIPQLQYHHDGTQTTAVGGTSDSFQVTVDDGAGGTIAATNIPVTITPVNQLPTVGGTNTLFEGQADYPVTITIGDPDQTAPTYGIKILSLPLDGTLKLNGTAVIVNQNLTSADLANLTFSHDGNDANNGNPPNVSFQVQILDDGGGTGVPGSTTAAIALTIRPNNDDPVLAQNNGLTLNTQTEGLTKVLTSADLQVTDPDSGTLQLTFTIKQAPDPTQGTIQRFDGTNWEKLGVGTTFTQDDLNSSRVRYSFHKSTTAGETFTDSFQFEVRDSEITEYPAVREGGIWKPDGSALDIKTFSISITTPAASGGPGGTETLIAGNALPTTVNNTGFAGLLEGETISITNTMLKTIDSDNSASELVYRIGQAPTSGTIKVNGNPIGLYGSFTQDDIDTGKVTFVHAGDEDFLDSFRFTVSDGTNILSQQTFSIDITPQNDSPIVAINGSPNTVEAGTVNITNAHLSLADIDGTGEKSGTGYATPNALTFTVTALPSFGILQVDQGSGYVDVTTSTIITKAELDGNKLRYVHNGTENFADSFSVQANDNTIEAPANNLSTTKTVSIEIASLNDAPVFSSSKNLVVEEGATGSILGANGVAGDSPRLVYTDTDNTTIQRQYRINTSTANGSVQLNGKALAVGSVFTQDDLDSNRVTYKHNGSENYTDSFAFEVRDGSAAPVAGTYGISITPKNDPPTLVVPSTQTFSTLTPLTFNSTNGNRIVIDDPDLLIVENGETDVIQVTLDFQATGVTYAGSTLTLGSTTGLTITQGASGVAGGKITIKGTKSDVQAALDGLQAQVPADEDRTLSLVVTVDDLLNGNPVIAATGEVVTKTINISASNVNDAPTITNPISVSVNEDASFNFTAGNTIGITDVDSFTSANNTVTISVTQGKLSLASVGLITGGANNSSSITLTGSLANINTALAGLSYQGNANVNGNDTLSISFNDQGNVGTGGALSANKTVGITLVPVNDAPSLVAPSGVQTIASNNVLTFNAANSNAISIDDIIDLNPTLNATVVDNFTVTLNATNGSVTEGLLTVASGSGATIGGSGGNITISGTKAQVNAALNGLTYDPAAYNADVSLNLAVTVNDNANGGPGALTASQNITINVSDINNAAIVTTPTSVLVNEDTVFLFNGANQIAVADPDDFGNPLKVTLTVGKGTLTLGTLTGLTFTTGDGTSDPTMTFQGSESAINTALQSLSYLGGTDFNSTVADTLSVQVNDLGNTGSGPVGGNIVDRTVNITVNPINDAPTRTAASTTLTTILEDSAPAGDTIANLFSSKFQDVKDNQTANSGSAANTLAGVAIVANAATVAQGRWQWFNGSSWNNITAVSITSALVLSDTTLVRFLPTADFNGTPGSLTTRLIDSSSGVVTSGSTVNVTTSGGVTQYSNGSNTVTLGTTVTAVNDAPVASGSAVLTAIAEDTAPASILGATVSSLFASQFSDSRDLVTGGSSANILAGVAIVGNAATTQGTWEYFNGSIWQSVGNPSSGAALIISGSDKLRFVPSLNYNGAVPALTVNLIDNSSGNVTTGTSVDLSGGGATGGTTVYSSATVPLTTTISAVNDAPTLTSLGGAVSFTENASSVVLDGDAIAQDIELDAISNWNGSTLTLQRQGGASVQDLFSGTGTLNPLTQGGALVVGGTTIGTVTTNTSGSLMLTFNSSATGALVTSALQQIAYRNSSDNPPAAVTINYTLNDQNTGAQGSGGALTGTGTITVNITAINDPPVLDLDANNSSTATGADHKASFTEGSSAVAIGDVDVSVTDLDNVNIVSATITLTNPVDGVADVLGVVGGLPSGITASAYNPATGVITLTGAATLAAYQTAIAQIKYSNTSDNPTAVNRAITVVVNDGAANSNTATTTISVVPVNDPPVLDLDGNNSSTATGSSYKTSFTEGGSAVTIGDVDVSVTDLDNTNIASATITLTNRLDGAADVLSVLGALPGGITASAYNPATGMITLTGAATLTAYQSAIAQVTYSNTSDNPTATDRTITVVVNDGTANSNIATTTISITPVNDPPVLDLDGNNSSTATGADYKTTFTEGGSAIAIGDVDVSVTDLDNANIASATITLTNRLDGAADVLSVLGALPSGITASAYNPATGVITLTGAATLTAYQSAIAQVTYSNASDNPTATDRTITVVVNDGAANSNVATTTISITPVNDPPVLDLDGNNSSTATGADYKTTFTEGGSAIAIGDVDVSVMDFDNTNIASATITLTNRLDGAADVLSVLGALPGGITASAYNPATGVITLTGAATLTAYQSAIAQVTYSNASDNPTATDRTITVVVNDGAANSNVATTTISITPVNDPPVLDLDANNSSTATGADYKASFTEGGSAIAIGDVDVSITDLDNANIVSATVKLTNPVDGVADVLGVVGGLPSGITASAYDSTTGVITLTGSATLAAYQSAIAQVTYSNTSDNPTATDRTITVVVNDGAANSNIATTTISITPVNDPPMLDLDGNNSSTATGADYKTTFTEGGSAVAIGDVDVSVTEPDNANIVSATITLTNRLDGAADVLSVLGTLPSGITASAYDPATGVITLTGAATLAAYQSAIAQVAYSNTLDNPTATDRTITVVVNDGTANSNVATTTVSITPVNDPPVLDLDADNSSTATGADYKTRLTRGSSGVAVSDVDVSVTDLDNTNIASATITLTNRLDGAADLLKIVGTLPSGITASAYDPATGIILLTGSATLAAYQTALQAIAFQNTSATPNISDRIITVKVNDGNADSNIATTTVTVNAVPNAVNDTIPVEEDSSSNALNVLINDLQGDGLSTITAISAPSKGTAAIDTKGTSDPTDDVLRYTPNADFNGSDTFTYTITDADGDTSVATIAVTVNPVADAFNDTLITAEIIPRSLNVLTNDRFQPGAQLTGITQGIHGSVLFKPDGTVTYNPIKGFVGSDSFTYTITTTAGNTETATVNVTVNRDTDGDTIADLDDLDDDNDGILDTIEQNGNLNRDTDGDGIIDRLDLDSDNDAILDIKEAGHKGLDTDGDGRVDGPYGKNGLADSVETAAESNAPNYTPLNTDGDSTPDFQDLDSDNDGISDVLEAGGKDPDGDGIIGQGKPVDTNGNGLADTVDPQKSGTPVPIPDQDGDGQPNFRDLDSDNDGISDLVEQGLTRLDTNSDGRIDGADIDRDGLIDTLDGNSSIFGSGTTPLPTPLDKDGNGIPDFLEPPVGARGSQGGDNVVGTSGDDILNGFSDIDVLRGLGGNDLINGGSSRDTIYGDEGNDILNGGSDDDYMEGGIGNDRLSGGTGNDTMFGGDGEDILDGGEGNDLIRGNRGKDIINGGDGNDRLYGDQDNDIIQGNRGKDLLVGGFGKDTLTGGQGRDRFAYTSVKEFADIITDFEIVKDRIDVKPIRGINSIKDLRFIQQGHNTSIQAHVGKGFQPLAVLQDVRANTLTRHHFIF
ncbi:MAG: tandem-95 repeat protein [Drouetiella hepatica Uher 2000/2452]|jgi:hypothetical protein|uniref:Tandem-95 repeat protein n=1 Tax=Drouetiella hepatica Uher 2000/2452 TaxID=904376 RepID=A0A951UNA4_9CYAN|nr:tandem-95 repeat protein [Drouetiella hepatica Uher 2000/2452]